MIKPALRVAVAVTVSVWSEIVGTLTVTAGRVTVNIAAVLVDVTVLVTKAVENLLTVTVGALPVLVTVMVPVRRRVSWGN